MTKKKEKNNKDLMISYWIILISSLIIYLGIVMISINKLEEGMLLGTIICVSTISFIIMCLILLKFEVGIGYHECKNCHHRFVPKYKTALLAPHIFTTRYLKCPKCHKKSWAKKVFSK